MHILGYPLTSSYRFNYFKKLNRYIKRTPYASNVSLSKVLQKVHLYLRMLHEPLLATKKLWKVEFSSLFWSCYSLLVIVKFRYLLWNCLSLLVIVKSSKVQLPLVVCCLSLSVIVKSSKVQLPLVELSESLSNS